MNISNLHNVIENFVGNDQKAIIVDGPWGAGKTTVVKQSLKSNDYTYISLFGLSNQQELIMRLIDKIDPLNISIVNNTFFIRDDTEYLSSDKNIIVLDDLERKNDSLYFESICGVLDSLTRIGFKIICIINSAKTDQKKFEEFKEKCFEKAYHVLPDAALVANIVNCNNEIAESLIKDVRFNLRTIIKAKQFKYELTNFFKESKHDDFLIKLNIDEFALLRCCAIAERIYFTPNNLTPKFEKDDFQEFQYNKYKDKFGDSAANNIAEIFFKDKENSTLMNIVLQLVEALDSGNFNNFSNYYAEKKTLDYPFNYPFFYLDDSGRIEYKNKFFDNMEQFDLNEQQNQNILGGLLTNYIDRLDNRELDAIQNKILDELSAEELHNFLFTLSSEDIGRNKLITDLKKKLDDELNLRKIKSQRSKLNKAFDSNDYGYLVDYLYKNRFVQENEAKTILNIFSAKKFFLPDLSKTIDYGAWSYCHEIARFVSRHPEYIEKFINVLQEQCNNSKSISLRDKCRALIRYNFDSYNPSDYIF